MVVVSDKVLLLSAGDAETAAVLDVDDLVVSVSSTSLSDSSEDSNINKLCR